MRETTTLSHIQRRLVQFNADRKWGQYHSPRNLAMALSVEANELLELFLWAKDDGPQPPVEGRRQRVEDEVADVLICLLNFAQQAGIDVLEAAEKKINKNEEKYPIDKAIGKLEKHTEL